MIQDHSMGTINALDSFYHYGEKLGTLIKESGAKPYVYMTWARSFRPSMQDTITTHYNKIAEKIEAEIVPVGLVWQIVKADRPDLKIYDQDDSHPSPMGTYLTACTFYKVLTGQSPIGLPHRIISTDKDGQILYLNIQSETDAKYLQEVVDRVVSDK